MACGDQCGRGGLGNQFREHAQRNDVSPFDSWMFFRIINGMARTVSVIVADDLDGSPDAKTVRFGFDGVSYEIDLGKKNRAKLDRGVAKYIEAGRRVSRTSGRVSSRPCPGRRADLTEVRAWARERGLLVSERGRISAEDMRRMNYAVDGEKKDAAVVVREYIIEKKLSG